MCKPIKYYFAEGGAQLGGPPPPPPPQCLKRGTISNFLKMTFLIWFHILDLKDICFLIKQLFGGKIQDFTAIFKKMATKSPKNEVFFQMSKKTGLDFLNAFCVLWAIGIHPNWWKITETLIHKAKKMKYDPHFWPNMHQNWWNLSEMGWLTLAHGLWWVLLPKIVITDPKNEIGVRRSSGEVIVLP